MSLLRARNQWATVWKHFKSILLWPNSRKDSLEIIKNQISFSLYLAFMLVEHWTARGKRLLTCCIFLKDAAGVRLILRGLHYNQTIYFFLRKAMLIYIYGPWQPYSIQSHCISKKQTSPLNVQMFVSLASVLLLYPCQHIWNRKVHRYSKDFIVKYKDVSFNP